VVKKMITAVLASVLLAETVDAAPASSVYSQLLSSLDDIASTSAMPVIPDIGGIEYAGYVWPIAGTVTSPFGWRIHPVLGDRRLHRGIDISAEYGTPVIAVKSGRVVSAGWAEGYGQTIIIEHDGIYSTLYGHNSELLVVRGTFVRQGQIIARAGNTGTTTGTVLHFEVRERGKATDPIRFLA
jgi:murein DD-endopeptidase MepM/ murein hydrolase activator NlpD